MNILKRLFRLIFGQKTELKKVETLVVPQQLIHTSSVRYAGALAPTGVEATVEQPKVEQPKVEEPKAEVKKATTVAEEPKAEAVVEQKPKPKRRNNYRAKQKKQKKNNENI
jgi:hypothetical protein